MPIIIVPVRRVIEERQIAELQTGLQSVRREIGDLQRYAEGITTPRSERTAAEVEAEARRILQTLRTLETMSVPVLSERYLDEIRLIRDTVEEARRAGRSGELGRSVQLLEDARGQIGRIGLVYEFEMRILINGFPTNVRVAGVDSDNAMVTLFDALEGLILNQRRFANGTGALRLYVENPNIYNADNPGIRTERDGIFTFVIQKGQDSRARREYGEDQDRADQETVSRFTANLETIRTQVRTEFRANTLRDYRQWTTELAELIRTERDEQARRMLQALKDEIDAVIRRLERRQDVSVSDIESLTQRYRILTGRSGPANEQETFDSLMTTAREIRGTGRTVADNSTEWYAQQAITLLDAGNVSLARMALGMALLTRASAGSTGGAQSFLGNYQEIRTAITSGLTLTPAMLSRFSYQLELATVLADSDKIRRDTARLGSRERRDRISGAMDVARERAMRGDMAGARRLIEMIAVYIDIMEQARWRNPVGSPQMEAAIDQERNGQNASDAFGNAVSYQTLSGRADQLRTGLSSWGRALSDDKRIVEDALARADTLAREGNIRDAQRVLTLAVMFVESVQRLGVRRGREYVSLDAPGFDGMRSAMRALSGGEGTAGGRNAYEVFTESYNAVQLLYVARESERLERFATRREFGREDVNRAIAEARARASRGDYPAAIILLEYVREFYGIASPSQAASGGRPPVAARSEGWRYDIFTGSGAARVQGYESGRRDMLQAIRLEIDATDERTRRSAMMLFQDGAARIQDTETLLANYGALSDRYMGRTAFISGRTDTVGRIPLEMPAGVTDQQYVTLEEIRNYDRDHAASDTVLRGSGRDAAPTLEQLRERVQRAAERGDMAAYNRAVEAFQARLSLVITRTLRQKNIDQIRGQIRDQRAAIAQLRAHYDGAAYNGNPRGRAIRQQAIDAITTRLDDLDRRLAALENATGAIPIDEYGQILSDLNRESRIGQTLAYLNQQIDSNEQFRRAVASERSDRAAGIARHLVDAGNHYSNARALLLSGDLEGAYQEYRNAVSQKMEALIFYRAEDSPTIDQVDMGDVVRLVPLPRPRATDISPTGLDLRFFPVLRAQYATQEFEFYRTGSCEVFSQLLTGHRDGFVDADGGRRAVLNTSASSEFTSQRLQDVARALAITEVSTFAAPAGEVRSMLLTDYAPRQREMRAHMRGIVSQGYGGEAGRQLTDGYFQMAERDLEWMRQRYEHDRKVEMYTMIGVGIAAMFIPKIGWAISGAIFTYLAVDRVQMEIRVNGHASTEAWVMLGLTVGTLGLGGLGAGFRVASEVMTAGRLATGFRTAATIANVTNLTIGVGMMGYGTYTGIQALRAGRTEEGILNLGMAAFGGFMMARAGISAYSNYRVQVRARAATIEAAQILENVIPRQVEGQPTVRPTEIPEVAAARGIAEPRSLLRFLRSFARASPAARDMILNSLPRHMRPIIERLAADTSVLNAADELAAGRMPINIRAIDEVLAGAIRGFDMPPPEGPGGGPRGTRPQIDAAGLLNPEGLRGFLSDLLIPDTAAQPALAQRAAARARLSSIRSAHPDAGTVIDALLNNPSLSQELGGGQSTPFTQRATLGAIRTATGRLADIIPPDVVAAEQQAFGQYAAQVDGALALQPEIVPQEVPNPQPQFGGGRMPPIRASGGGEGQGPPPVVVPPVVRPGGEGGDTGAPSPRGSVPRQGPRQQAPPQEAQPQQQPREAPQPAPREMDPNTLLYPGEQGRIPGRLTLWGRSISMRWRQYRAARSARGEATTVPEDFVSTARRGMEDTIGSVAPQGMMDQIAAAAEVSAPANGQAEVGAFVRSAPTRLANIVKGLYETATSRQTPRAQQEIAWRAIIRIMSHPNVRAAFTEMAQGDAQLARVMRGADTALTSAARARGLSTSGLREVLTRQPMGSDEVLLIIEGIEKNVGMRDPTNPRNFLSMRDVRARIDQLESTRIPQLQEQIAAQRRAAQAATGRAQTRAQARVESLESDLATARSQLDGYTSFVRNPANAPLATTQRMLGTSFASGGGTLVGQEILPPGTTYSPETIQAVLRLNETGVVPNDAVVGAYVDTGRAAIGAVRAIPTAENPVVQAMAQGVERSVGAGGTAEDAVLGVLRSEDMFGAVRARYGQRAADSYRQAVLGGSLDDVIARLNQLEIPGETGAGVANFARAARTSLSDHFAVLSALDQRVMTIAGEAMDSAGMVGRQATRTAPQAVAEWWQGSFARRALRGLFYEIPIRGQYRFMQQGREILRNPAMGESALSVGRMGGYGRIGLQMIIWGAEFWALSRYAWPGIREALTGSGTVQQGREEVRRRWGVSISEENARFVREAGNGRTFFDYLPNLFPYTYQPPGNVQDLRRALERNEILIDPSRLDDVLSDGRAMSARLGDINSLLTTSRAGGDGAADATRRLNEILTGFHITRDAVDRLLARKNKTSLDITDMAELRMDDWVARGIALRFRDFVIETFLSDCGISVQRGQGAAGFLSQNTDVFVFLWQGVQQGTIPINYIDDALAVLQRDGVLAGIRSRVTGTTTLDSQLRDTLVREHLFFEVPAGVRGQVEGIRQNSFLGILDVRASQDATFRPVFERILSTYRENQDALRAFNRFNLMEGENGEAIYGDAEALARLIVENPDTALARARERGFVGPRILGDIDRSLLSSTSAAPLVQFVRSHSDDQHGLRQWLTRHRTQIVNLSAIIISLSQNAQASAMSPTDIENYATQQVETFRTSGWWRGPTPAERQQAEEDARRRAGTPGGGPGGQRERSREDLLRDRAVQRNPRQPGFEMAPQDRVEAPADTQVQAPPQLTQEARQFYESDRAAGLGAAIEGRLMRMFQTGATIRNGTVSYSSATSDGGRLSAVFGIPTLDSGNQIVVPPEAISQIDAEIYRFLTSTNPVEVRLRQSWGITVSGTGPTLRVEIPNMRTTGEALQNYIIEYTNRRRQAAQPPR